MLLGSAMLGLPSLPGCAGDLQNHIWKLLEAFMEASMATLWRDSGYLPCGAKNRTWVWPLYHLLTLLNVFSYKPPEGAAEARVQDRGSEVRPASLH